MSLSRQPENAGRGTARLAGPGPFPVNNGTNTTRCMTRWTVWTTTVGIRRRRSTLRDPSRSPCPRRRAGASLGRGSHSVLDGQVDAHAAGRGHRVGGVADAEQPVDVPAPQPVQPHIEQCRSSREPMASTRSARSGRRAATRCRKRSTPSLADPGVRALGGRGSPSGSSRRGTARSWPRGPGTPARSLPRRPSPRRGAAA